MASNFSSVSPSIAKYIVIHGEPNFLNVSPFLLNKLVVTAVGDVKSRRKLRSGDILVETSSVAQATKLLSTQKMGTFQVTVTPHGTLNYSRGVISEIELVSVSEAEIVEELKDQKVCEARRINIRRDGKVTPTKHIILKFATPTVPSSIKAGYLNCKVRPYIPNPLRCFKCQRFGHSQQSCRGSQTCARCAGVGHEGEHCKLDVKCVNCNGPHTSFSKSCPKWQTEKEIQTLKIKHNISFSEARKIVSERTPRTGLSYAAALVKKTTIGTQTEPCIPVKPIETSPAIKTTIQAKIPTNILQRTPAPRNKEKKSEEQTSTVCPAKKHKSTNVSTTHNNNSTSSNQLQEKIESSSSQHIPVSKTDYSVYDEQELKQLLEYKAFYKKLPEHDKEKYRAKIIKHDPSIDDDDLKLFIEEEMIIEEHSTSTYECED